MPGIYPLRHPGDKCKDPFFMRTAGWAIGRLSGLSFQLRLVRVAAMLIGAAVIIERQSLRRAAEHALRRLDPNVVSRLVVEKKRALLLSVGRPPNWPGGCPRRPSQMLSAISATTSAPLTSDMQRSLHSTYTSAKQISARFLTCQLCSSITPTPF